jgi:hypothetical protein
VICQIKLTNIISCTEPTERKPRILKMTTLEYSSTVLVCYTFQPRLAYLIQPHKLLTKEHHVAISVITFLTEWLELNLKQFLYSPGQNLRASGG